jgi:hypothetical protein
MLVEQDLSEFLSSTFRSIWSLELLFLTADDPARCWSTPELVAALRASELVVNKAIDNLNTAGLVVSEPGECIRYGPVSAELNQQVMAARTLYARSPHVVRRIIVRAQPGSIAAFADAFKLRTD